MDPDQYPGGGLGPGDEDDDDDVNGNGFMAAAHHGHTQSDASAYTHGNFARPGDLSLDPTLNGHHSEHQHHQAQQQHQQQHYSEHQLNQQLYGDMGHAANYALHAGTPRLRTPSDHLSEASPGHFTSASPASVTKIAPAYTPNDRSLPDRNVTEDTIEDAYVAFILYCNPSVSLDIDTTDLRKSFRQLPRSGNKAFDVYHLMQLIEKHEKKEIRTWTQLVLDLGVQKTPDSSAQKLQQYAVRLKRWMHAMHIDAFFAYLLNNPHEYYQQIPPVDPDNNGLPQQPRAGVPAEEDLALRALHPETRPKRGRRKAEDKDDTASEDRPSSKRQHLDTTNPSDPAIPHFPYPPSTTADLPPHLDFPPDPWSAATEAVLSAATPSTTTSLTPTSFRWRTTFPNSPLPDNPAEELTTPISATKPRRRRHGPAVSSAWPSSGNPLTGKLRGRPPQNRSVRDGPFSTFPANPKTSTPGNLELSRASSVTATPAATPCTPHPPQYSGQARPPSLSLTVPESSGNRPIQIDSSPVMWTRPKVPGIGVVGASYDDLARRLTLALLQVTTDTGRLELGQAKGVAAAFIAAMRKERSLTPAALSAISVVGGQNFPGLQCERLGMGSGEGGEGGMWRVSWRPGWGGLKGELSVIVAAGEGQDRGQDDDEEGPGGDDDGDCGDVEELRRKVRGLREELRRTEAEMRKVREGVLRAVVEMP